MKFAMGPAPHIVAAVSVRRLMLIVLVALAPAILAYMVFFGIGVIFQIVLACVTAILTECIALRLRGKPIAKFATDGSALLTGTLLALALPPLAPWWIVVSGAAFAILVAKHLYGGLGYNIFNPAMVGYAALLVSFPAQLTHWPLPLGLPSADISLAQTAQIIFAGQLPAELNWDAISGATPLIAVRTGLALRATMDEIEARPIFGAIAGVGWQWIAVATLLGGIALLAARAIRWHIPIALLGTLFVAASVMHALDPGAYSSPLFHLFGGATMLGAFFIATDPVSAATSDRGRLIYGAGIGVLAYAIRAWGGYPDGIAFAVLLMNAAVPLIDRYTVPRIYGHAK